MNILDASALLAFLFKEKGNERVAELLRGSYVSAVNLSEVLGRFTRDGHNPSPLLRGLAGLGVSVVPFDARHAVLAAAMAPVTGAHGLSLGDRACLSLAMDLKATAVTADRAWANVQVALGVTVEIIR